ncbi:aspartate/glutamate racemase family protein [Prosthecomicrobium sp. N25]|uniref:aspartate/glutamate racemase family protein n=1 Tax=Prosthecomicrobium sp. N25 TaxID=3129254 RepID=UPI003077A1BB
MKTLGLIGGMSWESTAIYYRLLNEGARDRLGGLASAEILLWSFDFRGIAERQAAGDWAGLGRMMVEAGRRLEAGGAAALVICTNTMHKLAPEVEAGVGIPLVHIADATAAAILATPCRRPALLATRYTMEQDFYRGRLADRHGIACVVPDEADRALVHRVIYEELCRGIVKPESKAAYLEVVGRLRRAGADGVIFGCTEVGMILQQADLDVPAFDTTAIHAAAALDVALAG